MATTIITKYGSGAPTASDVVRGELAVDTENKRLYTEDSGGSVVELGTNPAANVTFGDDVKAIFGAGSDLQIYHDGTNSRIYNSTGSLLIRNDDAYIQSADGTAAAARFNATTGVTLYRAGSAKLSTTSTGIDVTGTVTVSDGVFTDGVNGSASVFNEDGTTADFRVESTSNTHMLFVDGGLNRVGIGTDSPNHAVDIYSNENIPLRIHRPSNANLDSSGAHGIGFSTRGDTSTSTSDTRSGIFSYYNGNLFLAANTSDISADPDASARLTVTNTGNVGIGTASPVRGLQVQTASSNFGNTFLVDSTSGTTGTGGGVIFGSDDGLGTDVSVAAIQGIKENSTAGNQQGALLLTTKNNVGVNTERMRIDSSGNLLVAKTSQGTATIGAELGASGYVAGSRDGDTAGFFNRDTSDGEIIRITKDGTAVGSIGTEGGNNLYISAADSDHAGLLFSFNTVIPMRGATAEDNIVDLGTGSFRYDDIYATNGTIQTSDRNEKQDIEALSEAEQRVAVACKGLLRKFRWKSSVEENGDDARIHFGIIAQDLQAAFEAEGLDAGRYAMFINSTWTDEETGEERSRMGVRYSELLAFIIAAI